LDSALATDELTIAADGRQIRPQLVGHSPADAGVGSALSAPPKHHWKLDIYRADPAMLRFLGAASQMAIVTETPEGHITYELWDDQRRALLALVQRLEGRD
jgi:hypothetical protein